MTRDEQTHIFERCDVKQLPHEQRFHAGIQHAQQFRLVAEDGKLDFSAAAVDRRAVSRNKVALRENVLRFDVAVQQLAFVVQINRRFKELTREAKNSIVRKPGVGAAAASIQMLRTIATLAPPASQARNSHRRCRAPCASKLCSCAFDAPQPLPLAHGMNAVVGVVDHLQGHFEPVGDVLGFVDGD